MEPQGQKPHQIVSGLRWVWAWIGGGLTALASVLAILQWPYWPWLVPAGLIIIGGVLLPWAAAQTKANLGRSAASQQALRQPNVTLGSKPKFGPAPTVYVPGSKHPLSLSEVPHASPDSASDTLLNFLRQLQKEVPGTTHIQLSALFTRTYDGTPNGAIDWVEALMELQKRGHVFNVQSIPYPWTYNGVGVTERFSTDYEFDMINLAASPTPAPRHTIGIDMQPGSSARVRHSKFINLDTGIRQSDNTELISDDNEFVQRQPSEGA